jgi:DnaA family protein
MLESFQYPFDFSFKTDLLFSNFVTSASNASLVHFLQGFAASTEQCCYVWGVEGTGKTHLLQALCQSCEQAVYLPLQQLVQYGPHTLDGLDTISLLVIDDVQNIAGKPDWEAKLFELFTAIREKQGKLCMAATVAPAQLPLQLADLVSRLQWGLTFDVQELDDAGKAKVLMQRAEQRGIELKEEVAQFVLQRNTRHMHDLMVVLDRLHKLSLAEKRRITIPFVKEIMAW